MAEAHQDEIAKLEALYASNPEGRVFTHLAEAYRKAGNHERAHEILADGLRRHPDSASAYVVLGRVLADGGDVEGSITAFRQALDRDAGNLVALRWLGDLTVKAGRVDEAIGFYHELIARDPSDVNLLDRVAMLEADRAAAMSAPPTTDHPAEPVEFPPDIESPAGIRDAAASLADIEALAAGDEAADSEFVADVASDDVLAALAASERRADPLESLAYGAPPAPEAPLTADEPVAADETDPADEPFAANEPLAANEPFTANEPPAANEPLAADVTGSPEGFDAEPDLAEPFAEIEQFVPAELPEEDAVFDLSIDDISASADSFDTPEEATMELSIEDMVPPAEEEPADGFMPDASLSLSEPEVDLGGFTDAVGGEVPEISEPAEEATIPPRAPVTETMAELYRNQGFPERAAEVYRQLLRERGSDERIERLLAQIDLEQGGVGDSSPDAAIFKQDASGELWLQEVESPWVAGTQDGPLQDTPYAWSDNGEDTGSAAPPIASYFESLLSWRPRTSDDSMLLLGEEDAVTETGAAARFMDAPVDAPASSPSFSSSFATADEAAAEATADAVSTGDPWEYADQDTISGTGFGTDDGSAEDSVDPGALDRDTFDTAAGLPTADPFDRLVEAFKSASVSEPASAAPPPPSAPAPAEDDLMPWETAPSSFGPPATPVQPAENAMPWEVSVPEAPSPASPPPPPQVAPAMDDLMPWETAPAAGMTPPEADPSRTGSYDAAQPEAPEPPAWSAADELLPGTSGSEWSPGHTGAAHADGGAAQSPEEEDDEDLEMFRSWLQSLKK